MLTKAEIIQKRRELDRAEREEKTKATMPITEKYIILRDELYSLCEHNWVFNDIGVVPWVIWYKCSICGKGETRVDEQTLEYYKDIAPHMFEEDTDE